MVLSIAIDQYSKRQVRGVNILQCFMNVHIPSPHFFTCLTLVHVYTHKNTHTHAHDQFIFIPKDVEQFVLSFFFYRRPRKSMDISSPDEITYFSL